MVVGVRFQVTQVMDAIEQRLTTDPTCAQAVVDLGEVVRRVDLDGGRPVNLVRVGMVVDALSRYLVHGGAMLYGVAERSLLSEGAFTSKERMVLSRWADDGLIEIVAQAGDRAAEVADLTGLPLIAVGPVPARWPDGGAGRVLQLIPRSGAAVLTPLPVPGPPDGQRAVGRAAVKSPAAPAEGDAAPADAEAKPTGPESTGAKPTESEPAEPKPTESKPAAPEAAGSGAPESAPESTVPASPTAGSGSTGSAGGSADAESAGAEPEAAGGGSGGRSGDDAAGGGDQQAAGGKAAQAGATNGARTAGPAVPLPVAAFTGRGAAPDAKVRISRHRFLRAAPNPAWASLLSRQWRCDSVDCPVFGEHRRLGQPAPALRGDTPVCSRHGQPLIDAGPRPAAYPVSIVVDDLPRRRLVVREGEPVTIGRAEDDPNVFSVAPWLHRAAAAWISRSHVKLEAGPDGLRVTDLSARGTVVWRRDGPDARRRAEPLYRDTRPVGEWDSIELYTGIEVVPGDHQLAVLGSQEPESVLIDAPTAAHRTVGGAGESDLAGKAQSAGSRAAR